MSQNFDNRKRAFADAVTVEAWHEDFSSNTFTADLHADVVFGTARIGGEPESPIRFRLSIKRAEIVIIVPETEPVLVDKSSVSRDAPQVKGHLTEVIERKNATSAKAKASASLSPNTIGVSGEAAAEIAHHASQKLSVSGAVRLIRADSDQVRT